MIKTLQGKPNLKKISRAYNEAFIQISKLWHLLPESAIKNLKSEEQLEDEDMEGGSLSYEISNKFEKTVGRSNSLKGQIASYKEKMAKKKLKRKLRKQMKKQTNASNKKELLEKKLLKRKENNKKIEMERKSEKLIKVIPEVSENIDVDENKPKKSKKLKVKFIDDSMEVNEDNSGELQSQEPVEENKSGLSNKKLKMLKKQEMKSEKKKERKKRLKEKLREEAEANAELMMNDADNEVKPQVSDQQTDEDNTIMFNKIDDTDDIQKKKFKKDKKIKGVEKDPKKALTKLVELNKRISELKQSGLEEKAAAIKSKHSWNKAILKADGVKVKDNVELLKKSIRKKEKKKGKSKDEWQKRTDFKEKKMADAQKKRKDNILKKKKEKKQKKIKKSIKKGRVVI